MKTREKRELKQHACTLLFVLFSFFYAINIIIANLKIAKNVIHSFYNVHTQI